MKWAKEFLQFFEEAEFFQVLVNRLMRSILGRHIGHAYPAASRGRGLHCRHDLGYEDRPGDDQHQDRFQHILLDLQ